MKAFARLALPVALAVCVDASATTFRFDDSADIISGTQWLYTQDGIQATVTSTGGDINHSGFFGAIGVGDWFSSLNLGESLSVSFDQPVTVSRLYFKSWQDPLLLNTLVIDQVVFEGGDSTATLTDANQGFLALLDLNSLAAFDLGELELSEFSLTPDSLLSGFYLWGVELETAEIPLPASAWLFGSALIGLMAGRRRRSAEPA